MYTLLELTLLSYLFADLTMMIVVEKTTKYDPIINYTGLHFLNVFKSQEEELIIPVAFFLLITNV